MRQIEDTDRGTREYAWIICSDVAWNSSSGPVVPAAAVVEPMAVPFPYDIPSRLIAARTLWNDSVNTQTEWLPDARKNQRFRYGVLRREQM